MSIDALRICETCGEVIPRTSAGGYTTPPNRYAIRRFCDRVCSGRSIRKTADIATPTERHQLRRGGAG